MARKWLRVEKQAVLVLSSLARGYAALGIVIGSLFAPVHLAAPKWSEQASAWKQPGFSRMLQKSWGRRVSETLMGIYVGGVDDGGVPLNKVTVAMAGCGVCCSFVQSSDETSSGNLWGVTCPLRGEHPLAYSLSCLVA